MGTLAGWWLGQDDNRHMEPIVSADRWDQELRGSGFAGVDTVVYDGNINNTIIAMPAEAGSPATGPKRITILHAGASSSGSDTHITTLAHILDEAGYTTDLCSLLSDPLSPLPDGQDIISAIDLSGTAFFASWDASRLTAFQSLLDILKETPDRGVLWLTGLCQVSCPDPDFALANGLTRVLRNELGVQFATLELDAFGEDALRQAVPLVLERFMRRRAELDVNPSLEWASVAGRVMVGRYHYYKVAEAMKAQVQDGGVRKLEQRRPGLADTLYWKQLAAPPVVRERDVLVEPRAVGLNFKVCRCGHVH